MAREFGFTFLIGYNQQDAKKTLDRDVCYLSWIFRSFFTPQIQSKYTFVGYVDLTANKILIKQLLKSVHWTIRAS